MRYLVPLAACLALAVLGCDAETAAELPDDTAEVSTGDDTAADGRTDAALDTIASDTGDDLDPADLDVLDARDALDVLADGDATGDASDPDVPEVVEPDVVSPPEEPEEPDPVDPVVRTASFRALHWNIAGGKENACRADLIRRAVMRYVREAPGPIDFISLNEVCPAQYEAIRDALRDYWNKADGERFAAFQQSDGSRVGNAFFSRRNVYGITRLELGEDQYGKRYLLCGRQEGRRVRVCTTHLTPGDTAARRQLARVLDQIEAWWVNQRDTVVIGGDFNLHPNDAAFNAMYAAGANTPNNPNNSGAYRELDDDDPNHCPGYGERTLPHTGGGPCNEGGKIDFLFVRANRIENGEYSADSLNIPNDCTGVCSDHRAVRGHAKIRFRVD